MIIGLVVNTFIIIKPIINIIVIIIITNTTTMISISVISIILHLVVVIRDITNEANFSHYITD